MALRGRAQLRVLVAASTIAACFSYVHFSTSEHHQVVHPSSVAFGNVEVGSSAIRNITISPAAGEQNDVVESIVKQATGCAAFDVLFPNGAPPQPVSSVCNDGSASGTDTGSGSGSCESFITTSFTFQASFTPTAQGLQTCGLNLLISGVSSTITLTGNGVPPAKDIKIEIGGQRCTDCVLPLGDTNVGKSATPQSVTIVNAGSGTAALISVSTTAPFEVLSGNGTRSLGPNASEAFSITCTPLVATATPISATLTIVSDDPKKATQTVQLTCRGVNSSMSPTPNTLNLPARVHELVGPFPLTLENTSASPITITSFAFDPPGGFTITGLSPGDQIQPGVGSARTVQISYQPPLPLPNPIGTLTVVFDGNQQREIGITGAVVEATFSMSPTGPSGTADLGPVCSGATRVQPFTLIADGDGSFDLLGLQVILNQQFYSVTPRVPPALPTRVTNNGGNMIEFDVSVTPDLPGLVPGAFTMTTDIPNPPGPPPPLLSIGLVATALPSGPNVTPQGPVDFGTVLVGASSDEPTRVDFTNCSGSPVTLAGASINGDQDFVISTMPDLEVGPNASATFEVVLAPQSGGVKLASLEIQHADGVAAVSFIGNGDGPQESVSGDPRDTYYRCSTGRATGAAPLLLVLFVVLRRRRRSH